MFKITKLEMLFLFWAGCCFGWAIKDPKSIAHWFGFAGSLFGATVCLFDKDRKVI